MSKRVHLSDNLKRKLKSQLVEKEKSLPRIIYHIETIMKKSTSKTMVTQENGAPCQYLKIKDIKDIEKLKFILMKFM